jgi:hypothetical protein
MRALVCNEDVAWTRMARNVASNCRGGQGQGKHHEFECRRSTHYARQLLAAV